MPAAEAAAARRRNEMRRADTMCYAAAAGDVRAIQRLLDRGCLADVADYDRRTGLMLAAANGQQVRGRAPHSFACIYRP